MKRMLFVSLTVALAGAVSAAAADDPIAARQALMKANGRATRPIVPMVQGQAPFDLAAVQKALNVYIETANKAPALFPPGSDKGEDTGALPAIWANKADFEARFAKLGADAKAALTSITDEASLKAAFPGVVKNCGGCHESYRARTQ